ncbi:MAG: DUF6340 family protein [Prevotellaceae bacterium]|nr:DUF6340 family protein [Prevotellaceae bacterium]
MKSIASFILCTICTTMMLAQTAEIVEIQLLSPPETKINFGEGDKNVAIVAIHYYQNAENKKSETHTLDSILVNTVANGIKEIFEESPVFEYSNIAVYNIYSDTTMMDEDMPKEELDMISEQSGAKVVIAIEFVNISANYLLERTKQRPMLTNVDFVAKINAYDVYTGNKVMQHTSKDNVVIPAYREEDGTFIPAPKIEDARQITAEMIGKDFAKRITPTWETAERLIFYDSYYDRRNTNLTKAYNAAMNEQDWTNAAMYWTEAISEDISRLKQSQIMYNIALSCEMLEKFELAVKWLEKAKELGTSIDDSIDDYANILKQRIEDKEKLDDIFE